jgi:hypothetical protein
MRALALVLALCLSAEEAKLVRQLTLDAIDDSFRRHVSNLFEVWLADTSQNPRRVNAGMDKGISAYQRARAQALRWRPPTC